MSSQEKSPDPNEEAYEGLSMEPETMMRLAQKTSKMLVDWQKQLAHTNAWEGDFQQILEDRFMADPPENGRLADEVLEEAVNEILPLSARLEHPRLFAFVPSSSTWPGVLADFLAAGFNINACTWLTSSGPSQIELVVIDWFRRWVGYGEGAGGLFTSGGSAASIDALVVARDVASSPERASIYMSDQTHSVIDRAAHIIGIKPERVRKVPCDHRFRMDLEALDNMVSHDREAGLHPIAVCANAGTANTGAIDPLLDIADYCETHDIWMHVDAAYGGFAAVVDEGKSLMKGIERADSIGLDAHKWFFQPYEAGCLVVKDLKALETVFGMRHDVLQDTIWGRDHPNFADRGQQLSRSFRALKVWMSVQIFGMNAFRQAIKRTLDLAKKAGEYVSDQPTLELLAPVSLSIVCFRVVPNTVTGDEEALETINKAVLAHVFWEDRALIASTMVGSTFALRLCIVNHKTTW